MALAAQAQTDLSTGYTTSGRTIPGTSAVAFAPGTSLQAKPTTPVYMGTMPLTSIAQPTATTAGTQTQSATAADTLQVKAAATKARGNTTATDSLADVYYPTPLSSYRHYGWLHPGLNVSLGMSVFASFGKHAPKGAGFGQNLSATWLQPLGKRGWMAVGGYVNHMNWSGNSYTSGGLTAELGYQFNEHWSAYVYGQKSVANSGLGYYGYGYGRGLYDLTPMMYNDLGDKLGVAVRWKPNPTLSVELQVEKNLYPTTTYGYPDRYKYNYPLPQP